MTKITEFDGEDGCPCLKLESEFGTAIVSIYGAHLLSYIPKDGEETLYMSPISKYQAGKAFRGGVPICWPWFGPAGSPQHGYARINQWKNSSTKTEIVLDYEWEGLKAEMTIRLGEKSLTQILKTTNTRSEQFNLTQALHSYWAISDISNITITGLEGIQFKENSPSPNPHVEAPLQIKGFIDRIYEPTTGDIIIKDEAKKRNLRISRKGSNSCIVWNIGKESAAKMSDLPDNGYLQYVCVETANAGSDIIELAPGATHELEYTIFVE